MKNKLVEKVKLKTELLSKFKKEHSNTKLGEYNVGQVLGGMRGMLGMVYQTSKLYADKGINYRGHDLFEIMKMCPKAPGGN
mgnify:FL=1